MATTLLGCVDFYEKPLSTSIAFHSTTLSRCYCILALGLTGFGFAFLHKPLARPSGVIPDTFQICFTAETPFLTFIPFLLQILPQTALLRSLPPLEGSESHLFQLLLALSVTTDFFERVLLTCVHRQVK